MLYTNLPTVTILNDFPFCKLDAQVKVD